MKYQQTTLLKALCFLGIEGLPIMTGPEVSKHLRTVAGLPIPKETPFDVRKLADEFERNIVILDTSTDDKYIKKSFEFKKKSKNPFSRPAKNFRKLGPKIPRRTC